MFQWGLKFVFLSGVCACPFLSLTIVNPLSLWFLMELQSVFFVLWISQLKSEALKYFLFQGFFSACLLFFTVIFSGAGWELVKLMCLLLCVLGKLGAVPFFSWFLSIAERVPLQAAWFLLSIQKIPPFIMLTIFPVPYFFLWALIVLSFLVGSFLAFSAASIPLLLSCTSLMNSAWILPSLQGFNGSIFLCAPIFIPFWLSYFLALAPACLAGGLTFLSFRVFTASISQGSPGCLMFLMCLLCLCGFPPFQLFFSKLALLSAGSMGAGLPILALTWMVYLFYLSSLLPSFFSPISKPEGNLFLGGLVGALGLNLLLPLFFF